MDKRSAVCKLSIALAVCCAVICGVAITPLIFSAAIALIALICLLCCVLVVIFGLFIWLFSAGQVNVFGFATSLADFGTGLFNFISPVAKFCFNYVTPIAGWIALGVGVLGIIFSSVGISAANKNQPKAEVVENREVPESLAPTNGEGEGGKKKAKKKRTEKGACVASLVVCIVFSVLATLSIAVAAVAVKMF